MDKIKEFGARIQRLINKEDLSRNETYEMFREVFLNEQPDLHQGAFLAALVAKGETVDEIAGAWAAIDEFDTVHASGDIPGPLVENSGTGMDRLKTFNVSSASAVVAASAGARMARHGARALTSACGTVDILEAVGLDVECDVPLVEKSIRETGIGLFNGMSPAVHPGALGRILSQIRFGSTLNIAASLANPARPTHALRGVYADSLLEPATAFMKEIGYERTMLVYGTDAESGYGMDEISVCGKTRVLHRQNGSTESFDLEPEDMGIVRVSFEEIATSGDLETEARRFVSVIAGNGSRACTEFVCANSAGILFVAGLVDSLVEGVRMSRDALESGKALEKLRQWIAVQNRQPEEGPARLDSLLNG